MTDNLSLAKTIILASSDLRIFGALLFKFDIYNSPTVGIETACVYFDKNKNKFVMLLNDNFIKTLTANEIVYLIIHEILHVLNSHLSRGVNFKQELYNVATDHVINTALNSDIQNKTLRGAKTPDSAIIINSLKGKNLSSEEVYAYLLKNATITDITIPVMGGSPDPNNNGSSQQGQGEEGEEGDQDNSGQGNGKESESNNGNSNGSGSSGNQIGNISGKKIQVKLSDGQEFTFYEDFKVDGNSDGVSNGENTIKNEARRILNSPIFNTSSLGKGNTSSNTLELIKEAIHVEISWTEILEKALKNYITETGENKSWRRVNKRMLAVTGKISPHFEDIEVINSLVIFIDTSGSVSTRDLQKFVSIIKGSMHHFKKVYKFDHDTVLYADDMDVFDESTIESLNSDVKFVGRGGTSHKEVYDMLEIIYNGEHEEIQDPGLVLMLTDFESDVEYLHDSSKYNWIGEIPVIYIISGSNRSTPDHIDSITIK